MSSCEIRAIAPTAGPLRTSSIVTAPARRWPGPQPLGSTTIVTSGVMPVKTLIATL